MLPRRGLNPKWRGWIFSQKRLQGRMNHSVLTVCGCIAIREPAQIVATHDQHIVCLPECSAVEIGDAVNAQDDGLAIEHKLLDSVFQWGFEAYGKVQDAVAKDTSTGSG